MRHPLLVMETARSAGRPLESNQGIPQVKIKYCLYARKSTEDDEKQTLSIDSQIKEMMDLANREGLEVVEVRRESHSAKDSGQRPVFSKLLEDIRKGFFNGILCWAPDRLSRNAGDLGSIVDMMDQRIILDIRTHAQRFGNSPNEKFLLMILGSQAKLENDHKGENVKRGLRAKCDMGWRPSPPPLGYLHDLTVKKGQKRILVDPERAPIMVKMFEKVAYENYSGRKLLDWFNKEIKFTTRSGCRIALSAIYKILKDTFYYGKFEYPVGSGKWYEGKHEPLITKDLFMKIQEKLAITPRRHPGTHEFDFTRLMYCGFCGSSVSAEEKFKHQKNGNKHRYVYYHCSKGKDRDCKQPAIREEELLKQLLNIIDKVDLDEIGAQEKIKQEVARYRKFSYGVLGQDVAFERRPIDVDIRSYAKYILIEGSKDEKRELLSCLRSRLELKEKTIYLKISSSLEKHPEIS